MADTHKHAEKRQDPRFRISQLIKMSGGREEYFNAAGVNLSKGGLMCETDESLQMYNPVFLMFDVPDETEEAGYEQIKAEGVVMHSSESGIGKCRIGIRFTGLSEADEERIEKYVERTDLPPV